MGIGVSIFLIALGAVLAWAVEFDVSGLDINVVGYILLLVGAIGLVTTLILFSNRRRTYVDAGPAAVQRERVVERDVL